MEKKMILRTNLMKLRESEQLTQEEFGKRINKSRSWVSLVEAGMRYPTEESLREVSAAFNIEDHTELLKLGFSPAVSTKNKSALYQSIKETVNGVKSGRLVVRFHQDKVKGVWLESIIEKTETASAGDLAVMVSESLHKLYSKLGLQDQQISIHFTLSNQGDVLSLRALPEAV